MLSFLKFIFGNKRSQPDPIELNCPDFVEPGDLLNASHSLFDRFKVKHKVCIGCSHYQAIAYGGRELVCAMHPYGVEGNTCPDRENGEIDFVELDIYPEARKNVD